MRFIIRKFVDAENAADALELDKSTPVHDVYLKEGEEPKRDSPKKDLIGFWNDIIVQPFDDEVVARKKH